MRDLVGLGLVLFGSLMCMMWLWFPGLIFVVAGLWMVDLEGGGTTPIGTVEQELYGVEDEEE
jgi:hypothetical protein